MPETVLTVSGLKKYFPVTVNGRGLYREKRLLKAVDALVSEGKITDESPVGRALKDSKKGDTVKVETPAGILQYKVKEIWKD